VGGNYNYLELQQGWVYWQAAKADAAAQIAKMRVEERAKYHQWEESVLASIAEHAVRR